MILIKKILVPTDLSDISLPAIGFAISLAKKHAAEVTVLHILPRKAMKEPFAPAYVTEGLITSAPIGAGLQPNLDGIFERKRRLIHDFLRQKMGPVIIKSVRINALVRVGKTVKEIMAAAKEEHADLIVMMSHRSGLTRLLRGTFTEWIVRRAPCPVLTIQPSAEVRTEQDERVPVKLMDKWAA
ncbi:MAG TPA: universal stress protein [Candidatus Binatia bacterium]|nr:universal stress protein [Candidatus Binatia bacterium]